MIMVVWQSRGFAPELVAKRYVRSRRDGSYRVFECLPLPPGQNFGAGGTIREWDTEGDDLPADVRKAADDVAGTFPGCVEWKA